MKKLAKLLLIAVAAISMVTFNSCSKDEDSPDYVGTWSLTETEDGITSKITIMFTETTYEFTMKEDNLIVEGEKGNIEVNGNKIVLLTTSIGKISSTTNEFVWYPKGSPEFGDVDDDYVIEYSVSGNKLTITDDDGDKTILTKE
jgi:hypothetical protein